MIPKRPLSFMQVEFAMRGAANFLLLVILTLAVGPGTAVAQMHGGMMGSGMMGQGMTGPGMMENPQQAPANPTAGGAQIFQQQCALCHANRAGAQNKAGPNLYGIFGRKSGSLPGYRYSPAMRNAGIVWREQTLDRFLAAPNRFVPGTTMAYQGIPDEKVRQKLIAYLKSKTP